MFLLLLFRVQSYLLYEFLLLIFLFIRDFHQQQQQKQQQFQLKTTSLLLLSILTNIKRVILLLTIINHNIHNLIRIIITTIKIAISRAISSFERNNIQIIQTTFIFIIIITIIRLIRIIKKVFKKFQQLFMNIQNKTDLILFNRKSPIQIPKPISFTLQLLLITTATTITSTIATTKILLTSTLTFKELENKEPETLTEPEPKTFLKT